MLNCGDKLIVTSSIILINLIISQQPAIAQIAADGSLPTKVQQLGNIWEITGGEAAGTNLFHSFAEFSVTGGATA